MNIIKDTNIYYYQVYEPYHNRQNPKFTKKTGGYLLDLKDKKEEGIEHYLDKLLDDETFIEIIASVDFITIVPSSDPNKVECGMHLLANEISKELDIPYKRLLKRTKRIEKLATGGQRSIDIHKDSIGCDRIEKRSFVLLMDDITTSGNSLIACREILLNNGASDVSCLAIGKTSDF